MNQIKQNIKQYTEKLNILYVEDDKQARESMLSLLTHFFTNITVAVDGEDGLTKFKNDNFDLVITDINMPNLNGLDMIQEIKQLKQDVAVLVLSAYDDNSYFQRSIKLNIDGYILKPIESGQIIEVFVKIITKLHTLQQFKKTQSLLTQYQNITNQSAIVSKTDIDGVLIYVNDLFCKFYEYNNEELIGKNHSIIRHPNNNDGIFKQMWKTIKKDKKIWRGVIRNRSKYGKSYYVQCIIQPILDINNNIIEFISLQTNITNIMNPKKQLEDFIDTTQNVLAFMLKIDNFEDIKGLYGEHIARHIDNKLTNILHKNTMLEKYRFETVFAIGDGKYIFATQYDNYLNNKTHCIKDIQTFQQYINTINISVKNIEYKISTVVSVAYKNDILENLTYGMNKLENTGKDFIEAYNLAQQYKEITQKNMEVISMVKDAIQHNRIVSYFQPIIDNKTKQICKYESLVRLIDTENKVISPFFFLDISKKGKYYSQITNIVLKNSFEALKLVPEAISINISALDIELPSTQEYIFNLLDEYKQYCSRVVFELLEDENVKNFQTIVDFINKIKQYGIKIAIDDFGAGYSNFERLLDYQPDILKIDGCLIKNILTDRYSLSIVETIVAFAKQQNIQLVAEFVENEEVFNLLTKIGLDYTQGYYFGEPQPLSYYLT